jgi:RNA polymerase sigma-B factor
MNSTSTQPTPRNFVTWGPFENRLLGRAQRDGDRAAMDELVRRMMPLARRLARKYRRPADQLDDLEQVASMALFRALQRFDPQRGVPFPAFAIPTIAGELKRYHRDFSWSVRVPRSLQERALLIARERNLLATRLGRTPTPAELSARCGLSLDEVREGQLAADAHDAVSLDAPFDDQQDSPQRTLVSEDPHFSRLEDSDVVRPAMRVLPERQQQIVALRFAEDLSQHEIASRVGLSQMHVSRLLRGALERMQPILAQAL